MTHTAPLLRYTGAAVLAVVILNLLLRTFVKLGGLVTTGLIAALVAATVAAVFRWRQQRAPSARERRTFALLYGGILGLLYLGLLVMMVWQSPPGTMAIVLYTLHYACYPLLAWLAMAPAGD